MKVAIKKKKLEPWSISRCLLHEGVGTDEGIGNVFPPHETRRRLLEISKASSLPLKGGYSLSIKFLIHCKKTFWITNVYGPYYYKERRFLWPNCCLYHGILQTLGAWEEISIF